MRQCNLMVFILLFIISCQSDKKIKMIEFNDDIFLGNIKSITTISYDPIINNGKVLPGKLNGTPIRLEFINDTTLDEIFYDQSQKPIEKSRYIYNNKFSLLKKFNSCLNGTGQITYEAIFDQNNNKIKEYIYSLEGELLFTTQFKYDNNNFLVSGLLNSNSYFPSGYWNYRIDNNGNVLQEDFYVKDSNYLRNTDVNEYDEKNRKVRNISFDNHRDETVTTEIKYNDRNYLVYKEIVSQDSNKIIQKMEYRFDKKGNWIEKRLFENGKAMNYVSRSIIYY